MKRLIIMMFGLGSLLLSGCSTSKKVHDTLYTTAAVAEQTDLHTESRETTESIARTETESTTAESEDARRIELEFDTTQPADSATGLPPVRRLTITDRRRTRATDTRRQTTDTLTKQTEITFQDSTRREVQTETIAERNTDKKSRLSRLPWLLVGLVLLALAWTAWKRRRR